MRNVEILHDWIDCLRWKRSPGPNIVGPEHEDPFPSCFWVSSKSWAVLRAGWGMPPTLSSPLSFLHPDSCYGHSWSSPRDHHHHADRRKGPHEHSRHLRVLSAGISRLLNTHSIIWKAGGGRGMGFRWAILMGSQIFLWGMLQPKAYRSGASKYRGLGQAPWIAGWQYCKDNFFSGLEMYFLHNLSLLYILSCYFPSFLSYSFSLFFNAPSSSSFRDI